VDGSGEMMLIEAARLLVFPALMAFAACSDLLTMTISNRITLALVVGFGGLALATGMPWQTMLEHGEAAALVLVGSFVLFARGWIGGGDAKLAAATALWFGWPHLLEYLLYASLLGGALTLGVLQLRNVVLPAPLISWDWLERLHRPESGVPYGIALAASALLIYPYTTWMDLIAH
jgi:prepilin peptidase CpaA